MLFQNLSNLRGKIGNFISVCCSCTLLLTVCPSRSYLYGKGGFGGLFSYIHIYPRKCSPETRPQVETSHFDTCATNFWSKFGGTKTFYRTEPSKLPGMIEAWAGLQPVDKQIRAVDDQFFVHTGRPKKIGANSLHSEENRSLHRPVANAFNCSSCLHKANSSTKLTFGLSAKCIIVHGH